MMNITQEEKSQFQETLSKISSETRMEMIQLGLNPFLESDVEKYWGIKANAKKLSFRERLIASFQLLFKKKITDKLFAHVLCKINDDLQRHYSKRSTDYLNEVGKEGVINPLVEKLEKKGPNIVSKVAPLYKESIQDALVDRYAQAIQNGELSQSLSDQNQGAHRVSKDEPTKPIIVKKHPVNKPRRKKKKNPSSSPSPSNTKKSTK